MWGVDRPRLYYLHFLGCAEAPHLLMQHTCYLFTPLCTPASGLLACTRPCCVHYIPKTGPAHKVKRNRACKQPSRIPFYLKFCTDSRGIFQAFFTHYSCVRFVGQTNYGYANGVADEVCQARRAAKVPGTSLSIQWGAVGDVGLLVKKEMVRSPGFP